MSGLSKEQLMKFAAAWQAMILLVTWYLNVFGIDTLNRLLFGIALLIVLVILFLKKDNTEKVAVAVGTIDKFVAEQKSKEVSEQVNTPLDDLLEIITKVLTSTYSADISDDAGVTKEEELIEEEIPVV